MLVVVDICLCIKSIVSLFSSFKLWPKKKSTIEYVREEDSFKPSRLLVVKPKLRPTMGRLLVAALMAPRLAALRADIMMKRMCNLQVSRNRHKSIVSAE